MYLTEKSGTRIHLKILKPLCMVGFSVVLAGSLLSQKSICEGKSVITISVTHSCPTPNPFQKPNGLKRNVGQILPGSLFHKNPSEN